MITPQILDELRAAYAAAMGNADSDLTQWYMLIDQHAEALFQRVQDLETALASAAKVVMAGDTEKRQLAEKIALEIRQTESVRTQLNERIRLLQQEPEELRATVAKLKAELAAKDEQQRKALKEITSKHDGEQLQQYAQIAELKQLLLQLFHHPLPAGDRVEHNIGPDLHMQVTNHLPASDPSQIVPPYVRDALAGLMARVRR